MITHQEAGTLKARFHALLDEVANEVGLGAIPPFVTEVLNEHTYGNNPKEYTQSVNTWIVRGLDTSSTRPGNGSNLNERVSGEQSTHPECQSPKTGKKTSLESKEEESEQNIRRILSELPKQELVFFHPISCQYTAFKKKHTPLELAYDTVLHRVYLKGDDIKIGLFSPRTNTVGSVSVDLLNEPFPDYIPYSLLNGYIQGYLHSLKSDSNVPENK